MNALLLGWVRVYTAGLSPDAAKARREEIESDLWEMQHDPNRAGGWIALRRMHAGVPDDIAWRIDVAPLHQQLLTRRFIAITAATIVVMGLWATPAFLLKGRREMMACADTALEPRDTATLRHEVLRCAGTFFAKRD